MSEATIVCPDWYQSVLQPSTVQPPCGESLEYDATFILLQSRLQPRLGAEYGDFVEAVEPLNWADIERDAQALLLRSKDIRLVIMLMRCRLRQIGVSALCEGIEALLYLLDRWPDALHPQLLDEGEFVPLMRANAFAELTANEGFLGDFRQQALPRATGQQLNVRDVERAYASPREEDALSELTMGAVQQAWQDEPAIASLQRAALRMVQLKTQLQSSLGEDAPDLDRLIALLNLFGTPSHDGLSAAPQQQESNVAIADTAEPLTEPETAIVPTYTVAAEPPLSVQPVAAPLKIASRADALHRLREVRNWFDHAEPSSPVISLLAFTEQTIGKSFVELLQFLPAELIAKLETAQESS